MRPPPALSPGDAVSTQLGHLEARADKAIPLLWLTPRQRYPHPARDPEGAPGGSGLAGGVAGARRGRPEDVRSPGTAPLSVERSTRTVWTCGSERNLRICSRALFSSSAASSAAGASPPSSSSRGTSLRRCFCSTVTSATFCTADTSRPADPSSPPPPPGSDMTPRSEPAGSAEKTAETLRESERARKRKKEKLTPTAASPRPTEETGCRLHPKGRRPPAPPRPRLSATATGASSRPWRHDVAHAHKRGSRRRNHAPFWDL